MFAKLARFHALNRAVAVRFGAPACNDNQPDRRISAPSRRRPVLFCRWRKAASGALECGWHTEATAASDVEEPDIGRPRSGVVLGLRNRRDAPFVTSEHIALCSFGYRM